MRYYCEMLVALSARAMEPLYTRKKPYAQSYSHQHQASMVRELLHSADIHLTDPKSKGELFYWKRLDWRSHQKELAVFEEMLLSRAPSEYCFCLVGDVSEDVISSGFWQSCPWKPKLIRKIHFAGKEE